MRDKRRRLKDRIGLHGIQSILSQQHKITDRDRASILRTEHVFCLVWIMIRLMQMKRRKRQEERDQKGEKKKKKGPS